MGRLGRASRLSQARPQTPLLTVGQEPVDLAGSVAPVAPGHLRGLEEPLQLTPLSHFCCTDGSLGTAAVATGPVA